MIRFAFALLLLPPAARAQALPADSVDALQEVVVTGGGDVPPVISVQRVAAADVARADAAAVAALARLVPGASAATNSRGETLVSLRGAGERQLAVFLDGAPLNVPWDHRLDLGLVPAGIVHAVGITKGPSASEYGTSGAGGVIELTTLAPARRLTRLAAAGGSEGAARVDLAQGGRVGRAALIAAAGVARSDGQPLPRGADVPFSQDASGLRTNTDRRLAHVYLRGVVEAARRTRAGLTLVFADAAHGVAPEAHLDPAVDAPRFWRYPQVRTALAIVSAETALGAAEVRGTAWLHRFGQHIEQFADASYRTVQVRQEDDDRTAGLRLSLRRPLPSTMGAGALRVVASASRSEHEQRDRPVVNGVAAAAPVRSYAQHTASAGATVEQALSPRLRAEAGAGVDAVAFPVTGDKPPRNAFAAPSLHAGLRLDAAAGGVTWHVRAAAGRKSRFPTPRELFGEALGRFLVNPALRPEASWLAEVGAGGRGGAWIAEVVPFAVATEGTIDQENVTVDGVRRRRRVNLRGSRVLGVEATATARLSPALAVAAHLTAMDLRRLPDAPQSARRLTERPGALGRLGVTYDAGEGPTVLVEAVYTGRAYSLGTGAALVPLPRAAVVNVRAGYRRAQLGDAEAFVRVDNLFDAVTVLQLGLPGPGRSWSVGLRWAR